MKDEVITMKNKATQCRPHMARRRALRILRTLEHLSLPGMSLRDHADMLCSDVFAGLG